MMPRQGESVMTSISHQRESMLVDAIDSAIILLDHNGNILHANPAACTALQETQQKLINQPLSNYLTFNEQHPDNIKALAIKTTQQNALKTSFVCGDHVKKVHLPSTPGLATTAIFWHPSHHHAYSKDSVTGLPDKQMLKQQLAPLLTQSTLNTPHALIYMTLNALAQQNLVHYPKQLNILMADLAALLSPSIRQRDLLTRPEDNAFALLLRGCDLSHAEIIARKLLDEINTYHEDYPDIQLPVWQVCTSIIPLTHAQTPEEALDLAHSASLRACQQKEKINLLNYGAWESDSEK
jgi:GGDEF domain-containing protein